MCPNCNIFRTDSCRLKAKWNNISESKLTNERHRKSPGWHLNTYSIDQKASHVCIVVRLETSPHKRVVFSTAREEIVPVSNYRTCPCLKGFYSNIYYTCMKTDTTRILTRGISNLFLFITILNLQRKLQRLFDNCSCICTLETVYCYFDLSFWITQLFEIMQVNKNMSWTNCLGLVILDDSSFRLLCSLVSSALKNSFCLFCPSSEPIVIIINKL